ncbi:MAG: STT3 domain-containing protein [archaeon]
MGEKEIELDFSKFAEKFGFLSKLTENKKAVTYIILILILLLSAWLRFAPVANYTGINEGSLSAMDPYWHYRHASEVLDHGYIGDTMKEVNGKMVTWDTMHDAPFGSQSAFELYPYFIAYSYKFFGTFMTSSLVEWTRYTPAIFGIFAVLAMFLLVRQLFGAKAGLSAAFLYTLSAPFLQRSVIGFSDSDAPIAFFTILTFYFFLAAWDKKSIYYALAGGLSLGLFGLTWGGYQFAPLLMLASAFFYFLYHISKNLLNKEANLINNIKSHFKEHDKKYLTLLILLVVGLLIIAAVQGLGAVKFWGAISSALNLKTTETVAQGDVEVRNVMLTVSEMNPPSTKALLSSIHITNLILAITFFCLLPLGLWKKIKGKVHHLMFFALWFLATLYSSLGAVRFIEMMVIPLIIFSAVAVSYLLSLINKKKPILSILILLFVVLVIFSVPNTPSSDGAPVGPSYFSTATLISKQSGPSLGPNWLNFFEWARTETPKDAIFASWWDPGHAVTALAERSVVADGSQNPFHVHDLGMIFTSTDEQEAVELLDKYNVSYFFTSSDLIAKYGPISFLGRGKGEYYPILSLSDYKQTSNGTLLIYNLGSGSSIIVNLQEQEVTATLRQGYQSQQIQRVFLFNQNGLGMVSQTDGENTLDAMLYLQPGFQQAIYLPKNLEENMLTRLHFFEGAGLEHFELITKFGEEIKVFKVIY